MLPYKLDTTNDLLTSRAGLLDTAQVMDSLNMSNRIDKHFPLPKSNRGYPPSKFTKIFILMQHEGSFHLDEVRHIQDDEAQWTYNKRKAFMPMVGHIAETGQIVDVDFRQGMYRQRKVIWRLSSNASSHYPKAVP